MFDKLDVVDESMVRPLFHKVSHGISFYGLTVTNSDIRHI